MRLSHNPRRYRETHLRLATLARVAEEVYARHHGLPSAPRMRLGYDTRHGSAAGAPKQLLPSASKTSPGGIGPAASSSSAVAMVCASQHYASLSSTGGTPSAGGSIRDELMTAFGASELGVSLSADRSAPVLLLVLCPGVFACEPLVKEMEELLTSAALSKLGRRAPMGPVLVPLFSTAWPFERYIRACPPKLERLGLFKYMFGKWPASAQLQAVAAAHALASASAEADRRRRADLASGRGRPICEAAVSVAGSAEPAAAGPGGARFSRAKVGVGGDSAVGPAPARTCARSLAAAASSALRTRVLPAWSGLSLLRGGGTAPSDAPGGAAPGGMPPGVGTEQRRGNTPPEPGRGGGGAIVTDCV